jgi:hypothetical protein
LAWARGILVFEVIEGGGVVFKKMEGIGFSALLSIDWDTPVLNILTSCPGGYSSVQQYCQPYDAGVLNPLFEAPITINAVGRLATCIIPLDEVTQRTFAVISECAPNFGLPPLDRNVPVAAAAFKVSELVAEALRDDDAAGKGKAKTTTTQKQKQGA